MYKHTTSTALSLLFSASTVLASSSPFVKRDSWGAAFSLGPAASPIISTSTTIYPGAMPSNQAAYLFAWLGISNGTGDLIQSIVGSYPAGGSECGGQTGADTTWCISSEVYGSGYQYVGELTTADLNYENGIKLNYTLIDPSTYLWLQTMEDAVTGTLLSTYNKTSGPMIGWGTALECNDNDAGEACTGTVEPQYYVNSTIVLEGTDESFADTLGAGTGVVYTDMETADGGKTWTIAKITIPAMQDSADDETSSAAVAASSSSAAVGNIAVATSSAVVSVQTSVASSSVSVPSTTSVASSSTATASTASSFSGRPGSGWFGGAHGGGRFGGF
ncbi:hypothetical protein CJF32_00004506 [Rutstroemia sp. NJR-2017a WRK4]|nr:hypothetical protein CJF32_00004506 [Rutstroemia sp. NJR-2017a WRK4]